VPGALLFLLCAIHFPLAHGLSSECVMRIAALCADSSQVKDQRARARHLLFIQHQCFKRRCAAADHSSLARSLREYLVQKSLSASGNKFAASLSLLSRSVGL
jgi:hypothetical protein